MQGNINARECYEQLLDRRMEACAFFFSHLTNTCNKRAFLCRTLYQLKKKKRKEQKCLFFFFCFSPKGVLLRRLSPSVTCCSSPDSVPVLHYAPFLFLLSLPFLPFLPSLFPAWYHALRHDHVTLCCCCCCVCVCVAVLVACTCDFL